MPVITGAVVLSALLGQLTVVPTPAPVASADAPAVVQQGEDGPATPTERLHQFGLGGSMGVGSRGGSGAFRYFFGDRIGFNATVGWYRPTGAGNAGSQGSTFLVAPSMVYMLTKAAAAKDIDVRPYVGGGLNYANGTSPIRRSSDVGSRTGGLGMQAFGGVELTFLEAPSIAISAEVAHYRLAVPAVSADASQGTNFYLLFHYYVR
jgi:hypothetical protein